MSPAGTKEERKREVLEPSASLPSINSRPEPVKGTSSLFNRPWIRVFQQPADPLNLSSFLYPPATAKMDVGAVDVARLLGREEADDGNGIVGYIECLVKLHKSIDVVVDLVKAAFHAGEPIPHLFYNCRVARLK